MPISFPSSPTTGQTYTYNNRTWIYNGTTWDTNSTTSVASAVAPITYNASTQTVGLDRTILPATAYTPALTLKPNVTQYSNLQEWQSNAGTILASVDTAGNSSFQNSDYAGKNLVINGGMDVWQRGTSIVMRNGDSNYTADRWACYRENTGGTVSRQSSGLTGIQYCNRVQRDSGNTALQALVQTYALEISDSIPLAGKTITFSFYARAGANYSATGNQLYATINYGTGSERFWFGFTGGGAILSTSVTLSTSWQRFTYTVTVPTNVAQVGFSFMGIPTGTAGAADYYEFTGVQLERGSVATPFTRTGGTTQAELAACQRYYVRWPGTGGAFIGIGFSDGSTFIRRCQVPTPVSMRANPSVNKSGTSVKFYTGNLSGYSGISNFQNIQATASNISFDVQMTSVPSTNVGAHFAVDGTSTDYFEASAELG